MQAHSGQLGMTRNGIALLWFLVLTVLCCLVPEPVQGMAQQVGIIVRVTGQVSVERQGQRLWANVQTPVFLGDRLETGPASTLEILLADGSRVNMASRASLEITHYLYNPAAGQRDSVFSLWSGKARFVANDLQGFREKRFQVQTHTGVVGTRDTDFIVHTPASHLTRVLSLIHPIFFCNIYAGQTGRCTFVYPFHTSDQMGAGPPTPPRLVTAEELKVWLAGVTSFDEAARFRNLLKRDMNWFKDFSRPHRRDDARGPGGPAGEQGRPGL